VITNIDSKVVGPERLALLYRVLDESFEKVIRARPPADPGTEIDIRAGLALAILEAFERGVVDPEKLKHIAIRSFAPKPEDIG
jgi:hypothetical protein